MICLKVSVPTFWSCNFIGLTLCHFEFWKLSTLKFGNMQFEKWKQNRETWNTKMHTLDICNLLNLKIASRINEHCNFELGPLKIRKWKCGNCKFENVQVRDLVTEVFLRTFQTWRVSCFSTRCWHLSSTLDGMSCRACWSELVANQDRA